jgi:hypothetical protein
MVVEHIFITTLERDDALVLADAFFTDLGLQRARSRDGADEWTAGKDRPRALSDFKRTVRVDFDRGRITLAASAPNLRTEQEKTCQPYMLALAASLEAHISHGQPAEEAAAPVLAAMDKIKRRERRTRLIAYIVIGVFLVFLAVVIIAVALSP